MNRVMLIGNDNYITNYLLSKDYIVDLILDKTDCDDDLKSPHSNVNHFFVDDASNSTKVISTILHHRPLSTEYKAIFSRYEHTIVTASILGEVYDCKYNIPLEVSMNFRNKFIQKTTIQENILTPKFEYIPRLDTFSIKALNLDFPIVYKPLDGEGTINTGVVNNKKELQEIIENFKSKNFMNLLLEEFIEGEEFIIDGWVEKDEIQNFIVSKYNNPMINIKKGDIISIFNLHQKDHPELYSQISPFLHKCINKLKLKNGIFHMEIFIKPNGDIVFSECAMRIGGGLFKDIIDSVFNINILDYFIELNINNSVPKVNRNFVRTGFTLLPNPKNINSILPPIDEVKKIFPQIKKIRYEWETGEELPNTKLSSMKRIGLVLIEGNSEIEVIETINKIKRFYENI